MFDDGLIRKGSIKRVTVPAGELKDSLDTEAVFRAARETDCTVEVKLEGVTRIQEVDLAVMALSALAKRAEKRGDTEVQQTIEGALACLQL
jgi:hypothetical protein